MLINSSSGTVKLKQMEIIHKQNEIVRERFSPYSDNGGSIIAIAGENFAIIASDTRLSSGYSIFSREQSKLFNLSNKAILGTSGCWADALTFYKVLEVKIRMYKFEHNMDISTPAVAQLISNMLYYKRFFPYYVGNILAGLDDEGKGCVFSYDPIGHCEQEAFRAMGSASKLLQPFLDNRIGGKNIQSIAQKGSSTMAEALTIIKDAFVFAAERDIYTGDGISVTIITREQITEEYLELRKD